MPMSLADRIRQFFDATSERCPFWRICEHYNSVACDYAPEMCYYFGIFKHEIEKQLRYLMKRFNSDCEVSIEEREKGKRKK